MSSKVRYIEVPAIGAYPLNPPSDRKILRTIYKMYYNDFCAFTIDGPNNRESKIYVPINCERVAKKLKVDKDIVFGRLYYHLQQRHGYKKEDGTLVPFFSLGVGKDIRCVNFPLLDSVLASLHADHAKFLWSFSFSTAAVVISIISLCIRK
ncbi:hypothetical protein CCL20_16270 [Pseudomonas syringae]|uniref:hypothetical protein n=1 Tax=Pseudomonas syringae TaxID=317 RepID=UPI000BB5F697|nr:hypothetical protein [Pseudomonas syringae]MCH5651192.1 hypothetical protein [Pseudomonas syringae]PBP85994.1 hypothetical protein CCL20_16270 [Pseudomonas syringae]